MGALAEEPTTRPPAGKTERTFVTFRLSSYTPIQYRHHNKQIYCTVRDCTPGWIDAELFGEFQQWAHSCRSEVVLEVPFQKVLSLTARAC